MTSKKINFIEIKPSNNDFNEVKDTTNQGFKYYMVGLFCGKMRCGKTTSIISLCQHLQNNNLTSEIILMSSTVYNNPWSQALHIKEENIYSDLNNFNEDADNIMTSLKEKINIWKQIKEEMTFKEFKKYYKQLYLLFEHSLKKDDENNKDGINIVYTDGGFDDEEQEELKLNDEEYEILENNNFFKDCTNYYKYGPSFTLILDDILSSPILSRKADNRLNKLISNHRHFHLNILIASQTYTQGVPKSLRRIIKQFFLWKFSDVGEIQNFYKEIGNQYFKSFKDFLNIYRTITNKPNTFMLIDTDPINDELTIRENFNKIIKI